MLTICLKVMKLRVEQGKQQFKLMLALFVDAVISNLRARFPSVQLISAMSILDPSNLPLSESDLHIYGNDVLNILLQYREGSTVK